MLSLAQLSLAENISGGLSAFGCFLVLVTFATFPDQRKKRYAELVFYVSINIFLASIGIALGNTTSTGACWFQYFTTNYNYLSAIFWTSAITLQVYLIVHYKRILTDVDMRYLHLVCWVLPLIVTFLPLTTNTVGETDDASGWCYIAERSNSPSYGLIMWEVLSFYLWVWIAIVANIACIVSIVLHLRRMAVVTDGMVQTLQKLIVYPVLLIVCWTGATLIDLYGIFHPIVRHQDWKIVSDTATIVCILQGALLSLSYFNLNANVCDMWYTLFIVTFVNKNYQGRGERRESQDAIHMREWRRTRGSKRSMDGRDTEWFPRTSNNRGRASNHQHQNNTAGEVNREINDNIREEGQGDEEESSNETTTTNSMFEIADRTYASEVSLYYNDDQAGSSSFTAGSSFRDSEWGDGGGGGGGASSVSSHSSLSLSANEAAASGTRKQRQRSLGSGVNQSRSSSSRSSKVILSPIRPSVAVVEEERASQVASENEEGGGCASGAGTDASVVGSDSAAATVTDGSGGQLVVTSETVNPMR